MANPQNPQDQGKAKTPRLRTSLATAIEQGKIELTEDEVEKVSGGPTGPNWAPMASSFA
jgi:hypothetical protein